jgi:hypothetical protein
MIHTADSGKMVTYRGQSHMVKWIHEPNQVYEKDLANDCALGFAVLETWGRDIVADLRDCEIDHRYEQTH